MKLRVRSSLDENHIGGKRESTMQSNTLSLVHHSRLPFTLPMDLKLHVGTVALAVARQQNY
jgi:hypothetical protein